MEGGGGNGMDGGGMEGGEEWRERGMEGGGNGMDEGEEWMEGGWNGGVELAGICRAAWQAGERGNLGFWGELVKRVAKQREHSI